MKCVCLAFALLLVSISQITAQGSLAEHVFFKHLIGKWHAEGLLTGDNAEPLSIIEDWEGKATDEGGFLIEGQRVLNKDKQSFRWLITHNASTDSYEAVLTTNGDEAGSMRFEGHVSEVNLTMEFKSPLGANGSLTVLDSFDGEDKNMVKSQVTITGDAGNTTLSGTITHKRVKGT